MWYPQNKKELNNLLDKFLKQKTKSKQKIHGIIVPHAGYEFSGKIAGKAFSLLKNSKTKKATILSPSHYFPFHGILTTKKEYWQTPLGKTKITENNFKKNSIEQEHAIDNQIPFLQKISIKEILPLLVGEIGMNEAKQIAERLSSFQGLFIISTDLSHFLDYNSAIEKDKKTINAILNLDLDKLIKNENSACGIFPLIIIMHLCKLKNWKPCLIEYKNSGDITGNKNSVVGYASFSF